MCMWLTILMYTYILSRVNLYYVYITIKQKKERTLRQIHTKGRPCEDRKKTAMHNSKKEASERQTLLKT